MLVDQVRRQVERLIPLFGVGGQTARILRSFDILCSESLDLDVRHRSPEFSRINADGTPFQFSLSLSRSGPAPLQFLGEAGRPGCRIEERLIASYAGLAGLARECGLLEEVERLVPALHDLAPEGDPHLVANASGIFWFALSFWPEAAPSLTVYINSRCGPQSAQWERLDRFAAFLGPAERWHSLSLPARSMLTPLGMAVTLRPNKPASGRIYLYAFGVSVSVYRTLFLQPATTAGRAEAFAAFTRYVLGDQAQYPTRSAVLSVELPDAPSAGVKFELCAHCAFSHDVEAANRISGWLRASGFDDQIYLSTVDSLRFGRPLSDDDLPSFHAYAGVGARGAGQYASIYLNPGSTLADE